jgi:hypothetical protein
MDLKAFSWHDPITVSPLSHMGEVLIERYFRGVVGENDIK